MSTSVYTMHWKGGGKPALLPYPNWNWGDFIGLIYPSIPLSIGQGHKTPLLLSFGNHWENVLGWGFAPCAEGLWTEDGSRQGLFLSIEDRLRRSLFYQDNMLRYDQDGSLPGFTIRLTSADKIELTRFYEEE